MLQARHPLPLFRQAAWRAASLCLPRFPPAADPVTQHRSSGSAGADRGRCCTQNPAHRPRREICASGPGQRNRWRAEDGPKGVTGPRWVLDRDFCFVVGISSEEKAAERLLVSALHFALPIFWLGSRHCAATEAQLPGGLRGLRLSWQQHREQKSSSPVTWTFIVLSEIFWGPVTSLAVSKALGYLTLPCMTIHRGAAGGSYEVLPREAKNYVVKSGMLEFRWVLTLYPADRISMEGWGKRARCRPPHTPCH